MKQQKFGVTNFAYGTGPYLRTTELLIAFNDELEKRGQPRLSFIVPWVYGEKQRRIMLEEFEEHATKHPEEIFLDVKLGELLRSVFYGDNTYEESLRKWVVSVDEVSEKAHEHLSGVLTIETLFGDAKEIDGRGIVIELNRSPRLRYNVAPAYSTTFGHIAEILDAIQEVDTSDIAVDRDFAKEGARLADSIERSQRMHCIAYPATFSGLGNYVSRYPNTHMVPPITSLPPESTEDFPEGIFVTVTGIPGLERLYEEALALGLKLYSNDTDAVLGSEKKLPHVVPNKNILFQFARAGWGSIWLSMLSGTPIVVPDFDPTDDPEIYFNNKIIEELGIGIIYRGQSLADILVARESVQENSRRMREELLERWGTLTGNEICAKIVVEDFLK
jgi:hypothetical protein